jgi:hypothetical protein
MRWVRKIGTDCEEAEMIPATINIAEVKQIGDYDFGFPVALVCL